MASKYINTDFRSVITTIASLKAGAMQWFVAFCLFLAPSIESSAESLWESRELLLDGKYKELEARFRKADESVIQSKDGAILYYDFVYQSLIKASDLESNSSLLAKLKDWHTSKPDSYAPLAALSFFHRRYGSRLRGDKTRKNTTEQQFSGMYQEYRKSKDYALRAIAKNKSALLAYEMLLWVQARREKNRLPEPREDGVLRQLLCSKNYPRFSEKLGCELKEANFTDLSVFQNSDEGVLGARILWIVYLLKSTPRWGGSYDQMHGIIAASKAHLKEDEVYFLGSVEVEDRMDRFIRSERYQEAFELGREYLSVGEEQGFDFYRHDAGIYVEMMKAAKYLGELGQCIQYGLMASKIYSWSSKTWADVGYCATHTKEWNLANFTLRYHADLLFEVDAWALFYLGESFRNLGRFDITYTLFKRAEKADPSYAQYIENKISWIESTHPESAIESDNDISEIIGPLDVDDLLIELSNKY